MNCISAIGLLDKQIHKGGIYTGQTLQTVLADVIGDASLYQIDGSVSNIKVYGFLPYATRRQNLHQIILATGISVFREYSSQKMWFKFLDTQSEGHIYENNIFLGGIVTYDDPASRVEVVEHGYYYNKSVPEEVLYDNSGGDYLDNSIVLFDKPIYPNSIRADGNITFSEREVNYCRATGTGVIIGVPYVQTTRVLTKTNPGAEKEKVIRVESATLVTVTNSENVLERLADYYFNAQRFKSDVVATGVGCGYRYDVPDPYNQERQAYIQKMSSRISSFERATCEFVAEYTPTGGGNTFNHVTTPPIDASTSGSWPIPTGVTLIRAVLIGKGGTGGNGENGEAGGEAAPYMVGKGGAGGKGGTRGLGGKILARTMDCDGLSSLSYATDENGEVTLTIGNVTLTSADGMPSSTGYYDPINDTTYAEPGKPGYDGSAGGNGGRYTPLTVVESTDGEDAIIPSVIERSGGVGGTYGLYTPSEINPGSQLYLYIGGGGGGGAAIGPYGEGGAGYGKISPWNVNAGMGGQGGIGGTGADASLVYGSGGNGGNGGGGGGGSGLWTYAISQNTITEQPSARRVPGGQGGRGSEGRKGCILIYY